MNGQPLRQGGMSRRGVLGLAGGSIAATALMALGWDAAPANAATSAGDGVSESGQPVRAGALADAGPSQPRWISRSQSRIVVNPYDVLSSASPVEQSNRQDVPLNAAYYAHDTATRLDDLLMLNVRPGGAAPEYSEAEVGFVDGCETTGEWSGTGVTLSSSRGQLAITATEADAYASRLVSVDLDTYPLLRISVPKLVGQWALRATDASGTVVVLRPAGSDPGVHFYDVPKLTGWSGKVSLRIDILLTGSDASMSVDELRIQSRSTVLSAFEDDFSAGLDPGWAPSSAVRAAVEDGSLNLTVPNTTGTWYGFVNRTFAVDLDRFPILKVKVDSVGKYWAIKVNNGGTDIIVQNNTTQLGVFTFDLPKITGLRGVQSLSIRLFVNGYQTTASFDSVILQERTVPWLLGAAQLDTTWYPHQLPFKAGYPGGGQVVGTDTFSGVDGLSRSFVVSGLPASETLQISGQYFGTPSYDTRSRTLTFTQPDFSYTVALPAQTSTPVFYADRDTWSCGGPTLTGKPSTVNGYWSVGLTSRSGPSQNVRIGCGFAVSAEAAGTSRARATTARAADPTELVASNERAFDRLLAAAPRPVDFTIRSVDADGVGAAQVRAMYYRAWAFLASSVLPPQPEITQPHPILATGKAALYLHGAPGARAAASWDSNIGTQFLAYVDPDAAWGSLEGILSLVEADGLLPGEFLPAREAQTAWVLSCLTGDDQRLRAIYPALKRLLVYKQDHPKYSGNKNPNDKDLPFVAHALIDTDFAVEIATRLGLDDDVSFWKTRYDALNAKMMSWFWSSPTAQPPQVVDPVAGTSYPGNVMSVTDALHVRTVDDTHASGLVAEFEGLYDRAKPLAGFGLGTNDVRYGITSHTIYGLLDHHEPERATVLSNAILRDATRTDMFAERYQWEDSGVFPAGQRPSLFGVADVIDAVWMNNGYRMDAGRPGFVMLPQSNGGVDNLRFQGRRLDVRVSSDTGEVRLDGSLVRDDMRCRTFHLSVGQTVLLPDSCLTLPPD
ncbi:hypothetical protein SAMN05421678_106287 [Actinopolymorpha cephalotaxi]|uniref:Uncharacterized protein n=1 Tax=Actinopolymorpha cephalotaxi TaxID=504797 RepID=A0A1I2SMP1_9ACTN|nr:hypothetical protein [Actinopolymorpha cephalotaxi]SFG54135.1 hypothetical protein SAMN05421678_106287 [Actinopolymorpha cephalotaxi]